MTEEYEFDYYNCYGCKNYNPYLPCNHCYNKEHLREQRDEHGKSLPGRFPYIPYAAGEDDDDW